MVADIHADTTKFCASQHRLLSALSGLTSIDYRLLSLRNNLAPSAFGIGLGRRNCDDEWLGLFGLGLDRR
jgi:hypothetical protein